MACAKPEPVDEPVRAVKIVIVAVDSIQSGLEFAGEVRARVESRLGFRVAGKLTQRPVELGQRVKAGQLLAQLDPQDYTLATDAAKAQLALASTNRNLAQADYKRFKELKDQNFISGAEMERREATLQATQAQLEQAQSQLSVQRNQAAYTQLLADAPGVVTAVEAERGQVVAAGAPIVRIAQDGPRDVIFSVPENRVTSIKIGSRVEVRAWSHGRSYPGLVREVAASADPVTRTYQVKVALAVPDAQEALPLGSTVYVVPQSFARGGRAVIKLPTSAFRQEGKTSAVWVLEPSSMTVRLQPVEIATADGNDLIVASGLTPGMWVVSAGVHVLSPGQKVTVYKEKVAVVPEGRVSSAIEKIADSAAVQPAASAAR